MSNADPIDVEQLIQPIRDDAPAGVELREDGVGQSLFFQIKEAREAARSAERDLLRNSGGDDQGLSDHERSELRERRDQAQRAIQQNWPLVRKLAEQILTERSKDLWVCAWLIESLVRSDGFAGLRVGFQLARELAERFWDDIHPRPDEDGYATTVAQFTGLNGEDSDGALIGPIDRIPLTPETRSFLPLTSIDFEQAVSLEKADSLSRNQRLAEGTPTLDIFAQAAREAPAGYFVELLDDATAALEEFRGLANIFNERCGVNADGYDASPPTSNIQTHLEEAIDRIRRIARDILPGNPGVETAGESTEVALSVTTSGPVGGNEGKLFDREEAFRALLRVADFFRRTEPHSPVSYALEQAVRWGRMSLPELMRDLVTDDSVLKEMFRRTGIPDPAGDRD